MIRDTPSWCTSTPSASPRRTDTTTCMICSTPWARRIRRSSASTGRSRATASKYASFTSNTGLSRPHHSALERAQSLPRRAAAIISSACSLPTLWRAPMGSGNGPNAPIASAGTARHLRMRHILPNHISSNRAKRCWYNA